MASARAIWKGVIRIGRNEVPVRLYSAVSEKSIHFRLLHRTDKQPVKQQMVNPETGEKVEHADIRKAYPITKNTLVILDDEELAGLEPEASRDIEITRFVDPADVDHRWYERAYYLGPDGASPAYFALAAALENRGKEGIARFTMRKKHYVGAIRAEDGYLRLITLRHAEEVIDASSLRPPQGRALDKREIAMAEQLVEALAEEFDPHAFKDEYRERVMELIETKAKGRKPKVVKFRAKKTDEGSLDKALAASLASIGKETTKRRAAGGRGR